MNPPFPEAYPGYRPRSSGGAPAQAGLDTPHPRSGLTTGGYTGITSSTADIFLPVGKRKWFEDNGITYQWDALRDYLHAQNVQPAARRAILEFFAAEGGFLSDGTTFGGITETVLRQLRVQLEDTEEWEELFKAIPINDPSLLTMDLWLDMIYAYHADDVEGFYALGQAGELDALEQITNFDAAAALFDVLMTHQGYDRIRLIQRTLNRFLPEEQQIGVDGKLGPDTFDEFVEFANDPDRAGALLATLAEERISAIPGDPDMARNADAWTDRFIHFAFQD